MTTDVLNIRICRDVAEARTLLTRRSGFQQINLSPVMAEGLTRAFGEPISAEAAVRRILSDVHDRGDVAVLEYTRLFDHVTPTSLELPKSTWKEALAAVEPHVIEAMKLSAARIEHFHALKKETSWLEYGEDGALGQIIRPLERIGIYVPGGQAAYPSSLLMTAIPARVADVAEIIVAAPPDRTGQVAPTVLAAASIAGVDRIFQVGGAQAIAALAYGTKTVPRVDKIFGPGNIFVVLAKREVFGAVAIDGIPGPTETLIVADNSADPELVAADLLAQAEHDPMASAIFITDSDTLLDAVRQELPQQLAQLERAAIARESLQTNGRMALVPSIGEAIELANAYAPEHLCLLVREPWEWLPLIRNAGGVFVGENSPEAIGDYTAGPSHVMPTGGTARFASPVNLREFVKVISVAALNAASLDDLGPATARFARAEGLTAHARAVERRLERRPRNDS